MLTLHGHIVNRELQALPTAHHLHRVPFIVIQFVPCEQSLRSFTCIENEAKSHTAVSSLSYQDDTLYLTGLVLSLTHAQIQTGTHGALTGRIYRLERLQEGTTESSHSHDDTQTLVSVPPHENSHIFTQARAHLNHESRHVHMAVRYLVSVQYTV